MLFSLIFHYILIASLTLLFDFTIVSNDVSNKFSQSLKHREEKHSNVRPLSSFAEALSLLENIPIDTLVIFDLDETIIVNRNKKYIPVLTESIIPTFIKDLQERGIKAVALTNSMTSFGMGIYSQEEWRHKQLLKVGIDFSKNFEEFIVFNDLPRYFFRFPIFSKGIIYTNRIPKGRVLDSFLEKMQDVLKPSLIIFFDDRLDNILDVKDAVEKRNIKFIGFVYNKVSNWLDEGMTYEAAHEKLLQLEKLKVNE